jgi:diguanylate cyclase (GGDEF)-like protein
MYVVLAIAMAAFWLIFVVLGKDIPRNLNTIQVAGIIFSCLLLFWGAGISLLDQIAYGQIIVYLATFIAISVVPLFQPIVFFLMFGAAQFLFAILLPYFQKSSELLFGNILNSTTLVLLSCMIARMRFKSWAEDFLNKEALLEKNDEIERVNSKLVEVNKKLEILSQIDGLTGVLNRFAFDEALRTRWNTCKATGTALTLFMIDVNLFKEFNDAYGHIAGDNCLKQIANALSFLIAGSSDILARYGGDEFAIISSRMENEHAVKFAGQLKETIKKVSITTGHFPDPKHVTVSIGVHSVIPSDELFVDDCMIAADRAMYADKASGKPTKAIMP